MFVVNTWGGKSEVSAVDSYSSLSAISFPGIFWWPGTQRKRISQPKAASVEQRSVILFERLCFFQFQFVLDCNELRLSVTITTLIFLMCKQGAMRGE